VEPYERGGRLEEYQFRNYWKSMIERELHQSPDFLLAWTMDSDGEVYAEVLPGGSIG